MILAVLHCVQKVNEKKYGNNTRNDPKSEVYRSGRKIARERIARTKATHTEKSAWTKAIKVSKSERAHRQTKIN